MDENNVQVIFLFDGGILKLLHQWIRWVGDEWDQCNDILPTVCVNLELGGTLGISNEPSLTTRLVELDISMYHRLVSKLE